MLQFMKKYRSISYALLGVLLVVFFLLFSYITQGQLLALPWNFVIPLVGIVASHFVVFKVMNNYADKKSDQLISQYNDSCDPEGFILSGSEVASQIIEQTPFNQWGSWYLSFYSLALIDQGKTNEARGCVEAMSRSAQTSTDPSTKFQILFNMYSPTKELYGNDLAKKCLDEILELVRQNSFLEVNDGMKFVTWSQNILLAEQNEDEKQLLDLYQRLFNSEDQILRMRVTAAYRIATLYERAQDVRAAIRYWEFVVQNGNTMSCVSAARKKLEIH